MSEPVEKIERIREALPPIFAITEEYFELEAKSRLIFHRIQQLTSRHHAIAARLCELRLLAAGQP